MKKLILTTFSVVTALSSLVNAANTTGYQPKVAVNADTRLDWVFVLANQSPATPPKGWLDDYDVTNQEYELYVPPTYTADKSWPVVVFISPSSRAMGFKAWRTVCEREGIIFAGAHNAGNQVDTRRRVKIVLDVLEDVRRRFKTDADRTYISGFSGGGRIACAIGFSLTEHFGGVIPICAGGDLREETWLRQRCIDRMSVAMITGEKDFNRSEVERFRGPLLRDVGVRTKVWTVPRLGHAMPPADTLSTAFAWLDEGVAARRALAEKYPAFRAPADQEQTRTDRAKALFDEAQSRLKTGDDSYRGLMLMKGVMTRWSDLPQASTARQVLIKFDSASSGDWREDDVTFQRRFLIARARSLDSYASGDLPANYAKMRKDMATAAKKLWKQVADDAQDRAATAEANRRIPELQKLIDGE